MIHYSKNLWNRDLKRFQSGYFKVENQRISEIEFKSPAFGSSTEDWGDLYLAPASIDLHVHARDFEESHKETFETVEAAAKKGGVAAIACLANTRPRRDSVASIQEFIKRTESKKVLFRPFAAVTKDLAGKENTDWQALLKLPIAGLSDDGKPIEDPERMRAVMKVLKGTSKLLSLHEEDLSLSQGSCLHESPAACRWGVVASPPSAEVSMVERDLRLAKELGVSLHFAHMSSREGVQLLNAARKKGIKFSAELTPHHALLTVDEVLKMKVDQLSQFKVCPPVRGLEDQLALRSNFLDGTLDCFATDHAPHSLFDKELPIEGALHGFSSLEWHWTLANELRLQAGVDWSVLIRATAERPAELLGLSNRLGSLAKGKDASFIVFDPLEEVLLVPGASKNHNGPWAGRRCRGKLVATWLGGERVYEARS